MQGGLYTDNLPRRGTEQYAASLRSPHFGAQTKNTPRISYGQGNIVMMDQVIVNMLGLIVKHMISSNLNSTSVVTM